MTRIELLTTRLVIGVLAIGLAGAAGADLIDRGGGLIYDTDLNVTWLQNANLASADDNPTPTTFGLFIRPSGELNWDLAVSWVTAMNAANYLGFNDWRLPTALNQDGSGPCNFIDCTDSEMGHLFYEELGNLADTGCTLTPLTCVVVNQGPFTNIQPIYWSGTELSPGSGSAWIFLFANGDQKPREKVKFAFQYAWAVRDGDVLPPVIPVEIDIKPGSDPNCFNINGNGVIPVAILGSDTFNVLDIDTSVLFFAGLEVRVRGKKGALCHGEFSNGDGFLDLVCQFEDDPSMWAPDSSAEATLTGTLLDGTTEFEGADTICVVP